MESSSTSGTQTPLSTTSSMTASTNASSTPDLQSSRTPVVDFSALRNQFLPLLSPAPPESTAVWYILTTAVLLSFHKEKLIGDLWTYLAAHTADGEDEEQLLAIARRIREACLKASTLVGFPRAINALFALKSAISASHPALSSTWSADTSLRSPLSATDKYTRGMSFFRQIYQQHTSRVLAAMDATSGGDLTHFAINCIYGELLSEASIIGGLETGLLEFVCCLADGCGPQAKGHFFGSINLGADNDTLRSAIALTEELARQLHTVCPWKADDVVEDFCFLQRVSRS